MVASVELELVEGGFDEDVAVLMLIGMGCTKDDSTGAVFALSEAAGQAGIDVSMQVVGIVELALSAGASAPDTLRRMSSPSCVGFNERSGGRLEGLIAGAGSRTAVTVMLGESSDTKNLARQSSGAEV